MKKVFGILIYIVIIYGCSFLGFVSPTAWIFQPVLGAFLAATPVLMVAKGWKGPGAIIVAPLVSTVLGILMGELSNGVLIGMIMGLLIVSELVRYWIGYENPLSNRVGYAIVSLMPIVSTSLLLWINTDLYYNAAIEEMNSVAYADGLRAFASPGWLLVLVVLTMVSGYVGTIVSEKVFK